MFFGEVGLPTINIIEYFLSLLIRMGSFDVIVNPCHYMIFESAFYQLMQNIRR